MIAGYLTLHLFFMMVNFGVLYAYFYRVNMRHAVTEELWATRFVLALLCSMLGPWATLDICLRTSWPKYGWKLWANEIPRSWNKWYKILQDARNAPPEEPQFDSYAEYRMYREGRHPLYRGGRSYHGERSYHSPPPHMRLRPRVKERHLDGCVSFWQYV